MNESYPSTALGEIGNCSSLSSSNKIARRLRPVQPVAMDLVQVTVETDVDVTMVVDLKFLGLTSFDPA